MGKKPNSELILSGNLRKGILALAIPIVLNSLLQTMYNLTDTFWLGKIGTEPMAAITLVSPIQAILVNFGQGIAVAGSILLAQYVGAKDLKKASSMISQIFMCAMIFSLMCVAVCVTLTPAIVSWLGATGELKTMGITYLQTVIFDMPFLFMINSYMAVQQSQGDTIRPMLLNLLGITLNLIMDPLFLLVFHWGIAGAALATLLAKIPCAIIAFINLNKKANPIHLDLSGFKFNKDYVKTIIKIGLPSSLGSSAMQIGFLIMSRNVLVYGSVAVAAYGIANRINGLISMPSIAMGSATSTIVGQNMGANQMARAEKGYKMARNMAVIFLFLGGLILSYEPIARSIICIFSSDIDTIALGTQYLRILAFFCWTNGIHNATTGLFRGTGHTMVTMVMDISRLWIFRFATLYICQTFLNLGVASIWYSVVISNGIAAFVLLILYHTGIWKKDKLNIKSATPSSKEQSE